MAMHKDRTAKPIVSVLYKSLPRYRIPFFEALRLELDRRGIELRLVYGEPDPDERKRQHVGHLPWAFRIRNRLLPVGGRYLVWQPCLRLVLDSDIVVVEAATRLLANYLLLAGQAMEGPRLAFWGHGPQADRSARHGPGEALKRAMSRRVHWWFAYTSGNARLVRSLGVPADRITVVQNTIDTGTLEAARAATSEAQLDHVRVSLGLRGDNVGIFCGGIYPAKRPLYLVEAAAEIRRRVPDFELIVIGAGPDDHVIRDAARESPWIKYVGPQFDEDRVPYFMLSRLMLLPGLVGLGIVDSFVFESPLVTIDSREHGPEIEYLQNRTNGLLLGAGTSPAEYARAVSDLLRNEDLRRELCAGCRTAARRYSMGAMVSRFSDGVERALRLATSRPAHHDPAAALRR